MMSDPDEASLLYGSTEHAIYEFQQLERLKLWEEQVARVLSWAAGQEFDTWEQEFDPQVCTFGKKTALNKPC